MSQPLVETIQRNYAKGPHKATRPVDASSIMLVDRRGKLPKVLMGRRNPAAKFMPGYFVFPGGRFEAADAAVPHVGALGESDIARLAEHVTRPSRRRSIGLALAAIRETFEETGVRLGAADPRAATAEVGGDWKDFLDGGMLPSLHGVRFMARAITPPGRPRRFDTRFFSADVTERTDLTTLRPTPDSELVELVWVSFEDAMKLDSAEITQIILGEVRKLAEAGFPEEMRRPMYRMRHGRFERLAL
jgi:8-oxo-dGTP pyrophosphatase MutT (NUDIX family)